MVLSGAQNKQVPPAYLRIFLHLFIYLFIFYMQATFLVFQIS